ncbi:DinB family protein [Deminuibacter soli]|nr:DUF1572 family protein [Deminuibacter soli]
MSAPVLAYLYQRELGKVLTELKAYTSAEALWTAVPGTINTGGHLAQHLVGNLRTYIGMGVGNIAYQRNRDAEFNSRGFTLEQLQAEFEELVVLVPGIIGSLTEADLQKEYPADILVTNGGNTVDYVLWHLLSHLSYHLGQLNYQRRYTGAVAG